MGTGICVAGNLILDITNPVERYPGEGELTVIRDGITRHLGGACCAVVSALSRLTGDLPIQAVGRVGTDAEGDFILRQLCADNVDLSGVRRVGDTSVTQVMSNAAANTQTFFVYGGAGNGLCAADFDWDAITAQILHVGYILLLPRLDEPDPVYGTRMAALLHEAQRRGHKTSVDIMSNRGGNVRALATPAMRYTDYLIINELEAQELTDICLRGENGSLAVGNMNWALKRLFELGVSTWAVIHSPEGAWGRDRQGGYVSEHSVRLPPGFVVSKTGAGDAFNAGVLLGAATGKDLAAAIHMGTAAAAISLSGMGAYSALGPLEDVLERYDRLAALEHIS